MATTERLVLTDLQKLLLLASIVLGGWLIYQLSPVLMPFFIAAMLAYLGDPLVDKLESWNLSRTLSVTVVFCVFFFIALVLMLILVPLLSAQLAKLIQLLPTYLAKIQASVQPWLQSLGGASGQLDTDAIRQALSQYGSELSKVAGGLFTTMTRSGVVILQWLANLVLVPVLTFYLLRDWDVMVARFRELLPRRFATQVVDLSLECDEMLAGFLRGQLMVMFALAVIYCLGLSMIGLEFALLLGIIAGLVSFVPYLGLIVGIVLAGLAAYLQFGEWLPMLQVVIVFAVAQAIEGMLLTPRFVGERIGLHPVAVIFAVLAGGQLFGFIGVLLALPIAAIIAVLIRHAHQRYVSSELYS